MELHLEREVIFVQSGGICWFTALNTVQDKHHLFGSVKWKHPRQRQCFIKDNECTRYVSVCVY